MVKGALRDLEKMLFHLNFIKKCFIFLVILVSIIAQMLNVASVT